MRGFYGRQVHAHLRADPETALGKYRRRIDRELAAVGLDRKAIRGRTVLDVGTGFQSIVFAELGASAVFHLDLDPLQVAWTRNQARRRGLPIRTCVADIARDLGPAQGIDLVFLCGVYHHLPLPCGLFTRLAERCAPDAALHLRCYRSGTWSRWLTARLRPLAAGLDPALVRTAYLAMHPLEDDQQFLSDMVDDLFVPVWGCFDPCRFRDAARRDGLACSPVEPHPGFDLGDENFRLLLRLRPGRRIGAGCPALDAVAPTDQYSPQVAPAGHRARSATWNRLVARIERATPWERAVRIITLYRLARQMRMTGYFTPEGSGGPGASRVAALRAILGSWSAES